MIHRILKGKKVILASASPRRRQIFELLGITALCMPADIPEPISNEAPYVIVKRHARSKAAVIAAKVDHSSVIIASDTIVVVDKMILGKPTDSIQAADYLRLLSGKTHFVYSAVCICHNNRFLCDYERSKVTFAKLSEIEIEDYIRTHEPMDKAGAYGIQGFGSQFIDQISGCYFNIMGFPIRLFYKLLQEMFGVIHA